MLLYNRVHFLSLGLERVSCLILSIEGAIGTPDRSFTELSAWLKINNFQFFLLCYIYRELSLGRSTVVPVEMPLASSNLIQGLFNITV